MTKIAIEKLKSDKNIQSLFKGNIALLCHSASVDQELNSSVQIFKEIFGNRFVKLFGPQHGFVSDVQDNMIETDHYTHPYFKLPVYSLYSETREPTDKMLEGVDTFVIDLQDVGTRVYTYITTMTYILKKCGPKGIRVIILDRPNPVGGELIEGNVLDKNYESFVGCMEIPQRHGMTMGEVANFAKNKFQLDIDLHVVTMDNWKRSMFWKDTGLHWLNPSPNLPTADGAITFCGTVLYEGTNISEGRGTTRSLEVIGHPAIEPYSFYEEIAPKLEEMDFEGFKLRPTVFMPTFQKHAGTACGGIHIHVTNPLEFRSWQLGQFLCRELYHHLKDKFEWSKKAYEYEYEKLPIDLINGSDSIRLWVENNQTMDKLRNIEINGSADFLKIRKDSLLY
ncbi:exo-beta-N-acetylmuramidase NamZ domain-containing protein [Bacteriovorax sp. Seq25_V]|uniref:exo-beta-N-acetylmuramidase NamZ family protein n=1 Tax=Bacteriovorax sp. Seq25_V TaxID=1201288 RepID=UPI000389F097|nr:DUF1343 domain-containing protein [Bacteriovorax sp. Seq25_V]EQC47724.1 PF07075 family protein [Bacteriovorax sp. Seq25_V]